MNESKKTSPDKAWIHSDDKMQDGIVYHVKVKHYNYDFNLILIEVSNYTLCSMLDVLVLMNL